MTDTTIPAAVDRCRCGCPTARGTCGCPTPCPCEPDCGYCVVPNPLREPSTPVVVDPKQERGGNALARVQAFTDAWTDVPGMEGLVAGLGIPTRLDLTIDDLRAVLAELERLRAEREGAREEWSIRHPSGNVGGMTYKASAMEMIARLNPTCTPVRRVVGPWQPATPQQPEPTAGAPHCTRCGRWDYDGHWTEGPDTAWLCGNCHVTLAAGAR